MVEEGGRFKIRERARFGGDRKGQGRVVSMEKVRGRRDRFRNEQSDLK